MLILYFGFVLTLVALLPFGTLSRVLGIGFCFVLRSDSSSFIFLLTLLSISCSVLVWSYYYIESESVYRSFATLILLFLNSIFILVVSCDLVALFVGWDLLGFVSFFLVCFYRSRCSLAARILTGLTNRIGDVFLLAFFGIVSYHARATLSWVVWLLILASFTKSAQVPFSSWLPAAMLAPTPVSALVHSSTLVTAGVYLLYRFSLPQLDIYINIGILTTLLAGLAALLESDIKKIIALSTLSQLGLIVTSLGFGERALSFAHLNAHASFKALLFLSVGTVIHSTYSRQESRALGGLVYSCPMLIIPTTLACASICGFIFLSGSVTKEAILEARLNRGFGLFVVVLFYLGIALTLAYSLLLLRAVSGSGTSPNAITNRFSISIFSRFPIIWLSTLSVLTGSALFFSCLHFPSIKSW